MISLPVGGKIITKETQHIKQDRKLKFAQNWLEDIKFIETMGPFL